MRRVLVALWVALAIARPAFAEPKSDALVILDQAIAKEKDPKALAQSLAELDALILKNPKNADAHYSRGWVLSRLGKNEDAVGAYDRAFEIDMRLADAPYNAGVVYGRMGNDAEAAVRFDRALKVNPRHVDAAFNAGQSYYDLKDYAKAAARWELALKLAPDDFQVAKRLLQTYVAAGKLKDVRRARERVIAMWSQDPDPNKARTYVYDQFDAGRYHVVVYESLEPAADMAYLWQAKVALSDKAGAAKSIGSVNLETSAALRDRGTPFVIGMDKGPDHSTVSEYGWKKQPDYKTFKAIAIKLLARF
jgi:tetratricopeptide (TPR) repeat protein